MAFPTPSNWFRTALQETLTAGSTATRRIDWNADEFRCALFLASHPGTANFDTDIGYGSNAWTTTHEVADGGNYTRPGVVCSTPSVTISSGTVIFDIGDATWPSSTITAAGALLYDNTLTAGNKLGIVTVDFGGSLSSNNGQFQVKWSDSPLGVLRIS